MSKKAQPIIYKLLPLLFLALTSCFARKPNTSGDLYYNIAPIVKLEKLSYRVYFFGYSKNDSNYFPVIFMVDRVAKGMHFKLSRLEINVTDVATGDTARISQAVLFCHHAHKTDTCHKELINAPALMSDRTFDIYSNTLYSFRYTFDGTTRILTDPKMRLNIQFDLDNQGKTETIKKTYIFERNPHFGGFVHFGQE